MADKKQPSPYENIKHGKTVEFFPNKSTRDRKFYTAREGKTSFAGVVVDVNDNSVDLQVYNRGDVVFLAGVPHKSQTEDDENISHWDYLEEINSDKPAEK